MKTAAKMLTSNISMKKGNILHDEEIWSDIIDVMIKYTKEAIKADRENVTKHAICYDNGDSYCGEWSELWIVDENSIINAPMINLL